MLRKLIYVFLIVMSQNAYSASTGSGFFITKSGYFVTNAHVISEAELLIIRTVNGESYPASLVHVSIANDIAILKVEGKFHAMPISPSTNAKRGAKVVTVGFPHTEFQGLEPKITEGIINSLTGIQDDNRFFQISAQLGSGNSGGPLIDIYGNVIGITTSKLKVDKVFAKTGDIIQNVNYAIKSNYLLEILSSLTLVKNQILKPDNKTIKSTEILSTLAEKSTGLVVSLSKEDASSLNREKASSTWNNKSLSPKKTIEKKTEVKIYPPPSGLTSEPQAFRDCSECPVMISIPNTSFAIGMTEVTGNDWLNIMGHISTDTDLNCTSLDCPLVIKDYVFANIIIDKFIQAINQKTNSEYRLPTDDEWKKACFANKKDKFCGGNEPNDVGWFWTDSGVANVQKVAQKTPNSWGLYDMSGNVSEYVKCTIGNCIGWTNVLMGGDLTTRSNKINENMRGGMLYGFRLVRTIQ